ncbi:MAG: NAD(P)-dependent oxidoreductase [Spirochaetaceae bacterium]
MNIIITGANGSLGFAVVSKLLQMDHKLFLLDRSLSRYRSSDNVILIESDITNTDYSNKIKVDIGCIIHLAAKVHVKPINEEEKEEFYKVNYKATKDLYTFGINRNVKHFIFISTLSVYGEKTVGMVDEMSECNPISDYAKSKHMAELVGFDLYESKGFPITVFRLATVFGKYDRGNYGKLIKAVQKGIIPMIGRGQNFKPIVYVEDAAEVIVETILNNDMIGNLYIVSENNYTYRNLIYTIKNIFNKKVVTIIIPNFIISILELFRLKSGIFGKLITLKSDFEVDNSKIKQLMINAFKYNFEDGLKDSYEYYALKKEKK